MDAFALAARLTLDSSEYDQSLKSAEQSAESSGSKISSAFKGIAGAAAAVTGATAAISTAFVKSAGDVASYGDNIDKMSQKMGMSATAYQEWDAVMQHSGTSMETLKASMKTLANAAQTGSDAFEQLGISQEEISKLSQEQLFSRTITALQNVTDETQRTYLAGKTLGRGATELGALLNTSAEDTQKMKDRVHELNGVMSDEAVKAAAAYQDSLQDMSTAFSGLKRNMVSEFLPAVTTVMDGLTELFAGNGDKGLGQINEGIHAFTDNLTAALPTVLETGTKIVLSLADAVTQNMPALLDAGVTAVTQLATGIVNNLPSIASAGLQAVQSLADGITNAIPELIPAAITAIDGIAKELTNPDTLMKITHSGLELVKSLAQGIADNLPALADTAWEVVSNLADYILDPNRIVEMVTAGGEIVTNLVGGILSAVPKMIEGATELVGKFVEGLFTTDWIDVGVRICKGIWDGIVSAAGKIVDAGRKLGEDLYKALNPEKGIDAIDSYNAAIETMAASVDDVRNSWHDLNQEQKDLKLEELGKQVEEASRQMGEALKSVSDGYFSFYTETLGDAENAIMEFAEKYEGTLTTLDSMGFSLNFTGEETADEVLNVLDELIQAMKDTGDESVTTSRAFYSLVQASDKLKDAKNNVDELNKAFDELAQDSYENIKILTANYGSLLRIPTEAARQMKEAKDGLAAGSLATVYKALNEELVTTGNEVKSGIKTTAKSVNDFIDLGFGNYKNLGLVQVLGHTLTDAENVINDKAKSIYQYQTQTVERQVALGKMTLEEQISAYKIIQGQFVEGSEQYLAAEQKVYSLQKQLNKEREDSEKESLEKRKQAWEDYAQKVQGINDQIADIQAEYDNAVKSRANDIANSYRLFDEVPKRVAMSGKTLISNLEGQVDRMKLFYDDLGKLAGKGVSEGLVQAIRDMGPAALDELEAILDMDEADLAKYNKTFEMKVDLSTTVAEKELEPMKQETESKISEMYGEIGALTAENALSIGTSFMAGIGTAIADNADTVAKQAKEAVSKSWQEAFGTSDTSSVGTIAPELTSNMTVNNENHFNFTLNGIQYQNITSLAKAISNELQFLTNRRAAGYAGT